LSLHDYAKRQYVVIDPEELDKLRTSADKAVNIDAFVTSDTIDPIYLSGEVLPDLAPNVPDSHTVCGSGAMPPPSDGLRNIWLDAGQ